MGTTVITPERSYQQRMDALASANEIRSKRAKLKRDLKLGRRSAADVLADPPGWLESMHAKDLLEAFPRVGPWHANRMLKLMDVSPSRRVGGLSPRQLEGLLRLVPGVRS